MPSSGEDLYYDIHLRARGHIVETESPPWGKYLTSWLARAFLLSPPPAPPAQRRGSAPIMIMSLEKYWTEYPSGSKS